MRNKKEKLPTEICPDMAFCNSLINVYKESNAAATPTVTNGHQNGQSEDMTTNVMISNLAVLKNELELLEECMICSEKKRDVLLKPCNHIIGCEACTTRCKKCLLCKETISEKVKLKSCVVCDRARASVLFKPCGHLAVCQLCALDRKECSECKQPIESTSSYHECCGQKPLPHLEKGFMNNGDWDLGLGGDKSCHDVIKLKKQLQDIKEQVGKRLYIYNIHNIMIFITNIEKFYLILKKDNVSGLFGQAKEHGVLVRPWTLSNVWRSNDGMSHLSKRNPEANPSLLALSFFLNYNFYS